MTSTDFRLEVFLKDTVAKRAPRKNEETITRFDRDIFWYDRDELSRQADRAAQVESGRVTYEDHRKTVETAVTMMRKDTQHDIAITILTHRFFKDYRAKVFSGEGSFRLDYTFLVLKAGTLFNAATSRITSSSNTITAKLQQFTTPTLVQINHIAGAVNTVTVPDAGLTLNEWAQRLNDSANESTSYRIAGIKVR